MGAGNGTHGASKTHKRMNARRATIKEATEAVSSVLGIDGSRLTEQSRERELVYARYIYANARYDGSNVRQIALELGKDRNTVDYYIVRYREAYRFDPKFRALADRVSAIIKQSKDSNEEDNSD